MLGFNATVGLADGLAESIAWHVERRRLMDAGRSSGSGTAA